MTAETAGVTSSSERSTAAQPVPWQDVDKELLAARPFGVYVHVPFCTSRCGYCDFNTYALRSYPGADPLSEWTETWEQEFVRGLGEARAAGLTIPTVDTVFVGGGTPSLLGSRMARILDTIRHECGLHPQAEVTCEANPESTHPGLFAEWAEYGVTRLSLGMQSASERILRVLDRQHTAQRAVAAIAEAQAAGFQHINLDLIYGTPGETRADLLQSVNTVLETGVDHISAYALTVEPGTALERKIRRGDVPLVNDDGEAESYYFIDDLLSAAGFEWYEISNWAHTPAARCRHNLGYWQGGNWWAGGPGAHGYLGGVRWSIVKNPRRYAQLVNAGIYPADWCEALSAHEQWEERIILGLRVKEGVPRETLGEAALQEASRLVTEGLLQWGGPQGDLVQLTHQGRMLADGVIFDLLCAGDGASDGTGDQEISPA